MDLLRVLLVEESIEDAELVVEHLRSWRPVATQRVATAGELRAALAEGSWDVVLTEWSSPTVDAGAVLELLEEMRLDLPFIVVSAAKGEEHAVAAIRAGAHDYVVKDKLGRLPTIVERELEERARRAANEQERRTRERQRRLLESTMIGIWFLGATGKTSFMNERMAQILGLSSEEAAHASFTDFVVEQERATFAQRLAQPGRIAGGSHEHRFARKDGSIGWAVVESSSIHDADDRFEGVLTVVTDITAQRRSPHAHEETALRYDRLFASEIAGVNVEEISGSVLEANDAFLAMVGGLRAEIEAGALRTRDRIPAELRAAWDLTLDAIRSTGAAPPTETEYLRPDGTRVPVRVGATLLQEGRILCLVTDRSALRRAEDRKSALVDAALDPVIGMDHTGAITEFNRAAEETFGYSREEVLGRAMRDLIIPAHLRSAHGAGLEHHLRTGEKVVAGKRVELSAMRRGGAEFPIELSISRVGNQLEPAPEFVGFVRDISDRERAEAAALDLSRAAALSAEVGLVLSADESLDEILERCCQAVARRLHARAARIWTLNPATKMLDIQALADPEVLLEGLPAHVPSGPTGIGRVVETRAPYLSPDVRTDPAFAGQTWAQRDDLRAFAGYPLLAGGELVGVMAVFTIVPMTERTLESLTSIVEPIAAQIRAKLSKRANAALEEQLRQSQKMEAVGRLAGGVAHDFNNLLSVVLGYSEMVLHDLRAGDPMREDAEEIRQAGVRATDLTRQLLMFSRQQVLAPKVLDVNEVLSSMGKMLQRLVGEDVELTSVLAAQQANILVDPGSIEQVIMNLVINARDAMPVGGKLTMTTRNVTLDADYASLHLGATPGAYVQLSVSDTGTGIDAATLTRIFEPFFTTKEKGKGTGLGLSTVFGIVQQSGGNLWVASEPGRGTTFDLYFPRVDAVAASLAPRRSKKSLHGTEIVLLVEDEAQVRTVARGILRRHGYTVIEAANAGEALLQCERHEGPIDLLLTDVVMPQMSGPEIAKRLLVIRPEMRALFMSGYTDDAAVRHGVIDSTFAFLQKPITVENLTAKVREVLDAD